MTDSFVISTRHRARSRRGLAALVLAGLFASACTAASDTDESTADPTIRSSAATSTTAATGPAGSTATIPDPAELTDEQLAEELYIAGYPLLVSVRTMDRLGSLIGKNTLFWQNALAGPDSRIIVAPNRDTLYSVAILDLRSEPLLLTLPEVTDRYFTYQLLSPWTESFAYLGTRATDGRAGTWLLTAPGWTGEAPDGATVIEAPTPEVFLLGRYLVDDDADIANVLAIRDQASLQPLSAVTGSAPGAPVEPATSPRGPAQDLPADASFFTELAAAVAVNPPTTEAQQALFDAAATRLGIADPSPEQAAVLDAGAAAGADRLEALVEERAPSDTGWSVHLDIGTYGDDVDRRAVVSRIGWGANVPEEAVYPIARTDAAGNELDGSRTYTITFAPDALPPIERLGFWSLSVYGPDMFFTPNDDGRSTIGDRTPDLELADDGSLTLTLSADEPATGKTNWLPIPDGPFVLMLRLYLPGSAVLDGTWQPPAILAT